MSQPGCHAQDCHAGLDPASTAKRRPRLFDHGLRIKSAMTAGFRCHAGLDPASTAKRRLRLFDHGLRIKSAMTDPGFRVH